MLTQGLFRVWCVSQACVKFGENPAEIGPSDIFGIFTTFVQQLQVAKKERDRAKQAEQRALEAKAAEEKRVKEKQSKRAGVTMLPDDGKEKGIMDDLVAELASGSAFRKGKRKNRRGARENVLEAE